MSYLSNLISKNATEKIRSLIKKNKRLLGETFGTIALSQAVEEEKLEIVQLFVEHGAEINDLDRILCPHEIPITRAAIKGNLEILRLLLDAGAEVNNFSSNPEYWTPLMYAVSCGNIKVVQLLVEAGTDVNEIRDGGNFALCIAARSNLQEIFDYLAPLSNIKLRQIAEAELRRG